MWGSSNECYGRYLGPVALVQCVKEFGAEEPTLGILRFLERNGLLVPILRYREPQEILVRRLIADHPDRTDSSLPVEPDSPRLYSLIELDRARDRWARARMEIPPIHPCDAPPPGAEVFFEDPLVIGMTADTYAAVPVGRLPTGQQLLEYDACVPLYRRWQALQLTEILNETGLVLYLPKSSATESILSVLEGKGELLTCDFHWVHRLGGHHTLRGFRQHRAALEAISWHHAYAKRAMLFAESINHPDGTFTISGQALDELCAEEKKIARYAIRRHPVCPAEVVALITWAGGLALKYRRRGRQKTEGGYQEVVIQGLDFLNSLGHDYDTVLQLLGSNAPILDELFPDWLATQRKRAMAIMEHSVVPDLGRSISPVLIAPDIKRAQQFLDWIADQGLEQLFWHFEELTSLVGRHDTIGLRGIAREVAGMAAAVEHICNVLNVRSKTLFPKLKELWSKGRPEVATLLKQHSRLRGTSELTPELRTAQFHANFENINGSLPTTPDGIIARDLLIAVLVRNHATHNSFPVMPQRELLDIFVGLVRAGFLTWHVTSQER